MQIFRKNLKIEGCFGFEFYFFKEKISLKGALFPSILLETKIAEETSEHAVGAAVTEMHELLIFQGSVSESSQPIQGIVSTVWNGK